MQRHDSSSRAEKLPDGVRSLPAVRADAAARGDAAASRALATRLERRSFLRAAFWFALVLLAAEFVARRVPTSEGERRTWLARQAPHRVVLLGDSTAHHGLSPERLREAAGVDSVNFAIPSGSGIIAYGEASAVRWRPSLVVYAGAPIEAFDTWALQRTERQLVPLRKLAESGMFDADTLLARLSKVYQFSFLVYPKALAGVRSYFGAAGTAPELDHHVAKAADDGFIPLLRARPHDPAKQQADAERKARIWFQHISQTSTVRADALVGAMSEWSRGGARRALILMPFSSPLRAQLEAHFPRPAVLARWRTVADASDASLLDCTAAMPDDAFFDDDHMHADAARAFSALVAPWIASIARPNAEADGDRSSVLPAPPGCARLR